MSPLSSLLGIFSVLILGTMSPGPSFVMVARTSVSCSRTDGLFSALGMGVGGMTLAVAALLGIHSLLLTVAPAYLALKVVGGLYLAYLGVRCWRHAKTPLPFSDPPQNNAKVRRSFVLGLTTQLSNPKAILVYASVFAAFLPSGAGLGFSLAVAAFAFTIEFAWYAIVALAFSSEKPRATYLRFKPWVDRAAGGVMVAIGLKLISSAHPS